MENAVSALVYSSTTPSSPLSSVQPQLLHFVHLLNNKKKQISVFEELTDYR